VAIEVGNAFAESPTMSHPWRTAALCLVAAIGCTPANYGEIDDHYVPDSPAVYVAKVKNILVGMPPTDAEVAAVIADPTALNGLVSTWMATPQYQQKMMVFFELAFQQTQIATSDFANVNPPNGLRTATDTTLTTQNAIESFARTVIADNAAGQPLNSAFTTKTLMMTTALMNLYSYFDTHQVNDASAVVDQFRTDNPKLNITLDGSGSISIADSANPSSSDYLQFVNPAILTHQYPAGQEACDGVPSITFAATSQNLEDVLYGIIPAHTVGSGSDAVNCVITGSTDVIWQASDFTDWRMVTIRTPNPGEATTSFFDLANMRSSSELVLNASKPGFFSTPAFQANWPTNSSNQMRVTANQALIVSTGTAIDGTDQTTTGMAMPPGLDADHAAPGTACFGCHQLLDPIRSIFTENYTFFYSSPQTDPLFDKQPGMFAFQGIVSQVSSIEKFASIIASHPLVPQAWAQKLCYYVNSAACDTTDPVFQQIVADFANGFSWNTLVAELVTSPIVTNATQTKTFDTNGEVIAVSRRDHLCAALDNRLGFTDICQILLPDQSPLTTIGQIVGGLPSDGYGRGATIPVLPNQPTLFYRGGMENICEQISSMVIDAKPTTSQPNVKIWSSTQPQQAISDFVSQIMSLTASDPRSAQANAILTSHFQAAQAAGADATDSLRSTFVAACLSPSFIGIGM
jgi:hypothetical protein